MSSTSSKLRSKFGLKLRLTGAFAALLALALAVGCRGFFPATTFTSITIEPTTPDVPLNGNQSLQLWGTDSTTNVTDQITSGASWSIGTGTTGNATVTNGGLVSGTTVGAITINAEYQGLTSTASGVVYIANITSICVSTSNTSGSCSTSTEGLTGANPVLLYAIANYTVNGQTQTIDITTSATWTLGGADAADITCDTSTSPAICSETTEVTSAGTADVVVSYPQTSITAQNNFNVSQ